MAKVGEDLWRSPFQAPCSQQGQPKPVAQGHISSLGE